MSARCSESNDVPHVGVDHSRRELARSGQVGVGSGQMIYQNVRLDILNPTMYYTWGCDFSNSHKTPHYLKPGFTRKNFSISFCLTADLCQSLNIAVIANLDCRLSPYNDSPMVSRLWQVLSRDQSNCPTERVLCRCFA